MRTGPIVIVEDDAEDQELLKEVFQDLGISNELKFFENGQKALDYLYTTSDKPFIIISDINMPVMNGIQLRNRISQDPFLVRKSIPFIFYTTHAHEDAVKEAYYMSVQGFFEKPHSVDAIKNLMKDLVAYWIVCRHPNN